MSIQSEHEFARIVGNSMNLAHLLDGTVHAFQPTDAAEHGDVVVARLADGGQVVKRLCLHHGLAWLLPESTEPVFEPRLMGEGDTIVGVILDVPARKWVIPPDLPALGTASDLRMPLQPRATDAQWREERKIIPWPTEPRRRQVKPVPATSALEDMTWDESWAHTREANQRTAAEWGAFLVEAAAEKDSRPREYF